MSERVCRHLVVRGRVQGVWFREAMRIEAERLAVAGWVRNRRDGSVEAMIEGADTAVARLIDWAHRGPEQALVTAVEIAPGDGGYAKFEKRPDA
jgi:acylphosphatase